MDPKACPGIGGTTAQSLYQRWVAEKKQPLNQSMGWSYADFQILFNAIERAGTLNKDKVNEALGQTDMATISYRAKVDANQFISFPLAWGQWVKTDKPSVWEWQTVVSAHDFMPSTSNPIFPIP